MRTCLLLTTLLLLGSAGLRASPSTADDAALRAVRFVDLNEGWAVGDEGVIWHTIDGGKTWERQPSGTQASLRAVQFLTPYTGYVVGRKELLNGAGSQGVMLATADGGATWNEVTSSLLPGLNAVQFFDENKGIVAGDGTAAFPTGVFTTTDGGKSWKMLNGKRARSWNGLAMTDLQNGEITGDNLTVPVKDGKIGGNNVPTVPAWVRMAGCSLPINGIHVLDTNHNWAVGELGTILGTTDGGKTWNVLKCGGQRAAVLFAHARPESVPFGTVATLSKDGYRCAAVCMTPGEEPRLSAAMRSCGGAAAEVGGDVATPAKLERDEALLARLVLSIRTWRPEVIVTDRLSPDAPLPDQLVLMHMKEAFTLAADPKAFPEQIEKFGLAPYAAKKLYALTPDSESVNVTMDLTVFLPELGDAPKDYAESAALLLGTTCPDAARFRLIAHRLLGSEEHTALMQGIELAEGGTARRTKREPAESIAERQKASELRRQLEKTIANPTAVGGMEKALTQAINSLGTMPADMASRTAVSLGMTLARSGQWTAARELFAFVAGKYPAQPAAVEAARWLLRYHASSEVRRRIELGHLPVFQKAAFTPEEAAGVQQVSYIDEFTAKAVYKFTTPEAARQWNEACLNLAPTLAAFGAGYALDPANNLALVAARRKLGLNMDAANQLKGLIRDPDTDGWQRRMTDELSLLSNVAPKHTPTAECRIISVRPMLDGQFDEGCWKSATPLIANPSEGYTTEARFACDEKFLYVAVTCTHPSGKQVPTADRRGRDADLSGYDRVEILLDLDRDYQTYYRLRVDQRGCVAEDCWGDTAWNPRWFVAVEPTGTGWTAEAAIPIAELTGKPPTTGQTWAVNLVRVVPGVGVGSWGGPSDATPTPEAMGLMRFIGEAK